MALNIDRELSFIKDNLPHGDRLANALQRVVDGVNGGFKNLAADATSSLTPPPTIQALQVKTDGNGNVHAVIHDSSEIQRNIHYFVEADTDPSFPQPHVIHAGTSRTMKPVPLPANDDNATPQMFYFRAYSQYPGGQPSTPVHFGGTTPTPVAPGGTANMTLLPSTGSGTAQATGQAGGSGFGKVLVRPAAGPKRRSF